MKITIISKLFCSIALCASLMSFNNPNDNETKKKNPEKAAAFKASVLQTGEKGFKVKLAVDKGTDQSLRIFLKDKGGRVYYSEMFSKREDKYRRIFDLADMTDGTYVFELHYNNQKITKEVELETTTERVISLQ